MLEYSEIDRRSAGERIIFARLILDRIFSYSTPGTILRISRTCRMANETATYYIRFAFDIDRYLSRFFPDPKPFRVMQAELGAVIAGASALHFMDRTTRYSHELDVILPQAAGWWHPLMQTSIPRAFDEVLVKSGYNFDWGYQPLQTISDYSAMDTVYRAVRTDEQSGEVYAVNAIVVPAQNAGGAESPLHLVCCNRTTCLMNVITHAAAYSLFPKSTFEDRRTRLLGFHLMDGRPTIDTKYKQLDWTPAYETSLDRPPQLFTTANRHWTDTQAWHLPLDTSTLTLPTSSYLNTSTVSLDPVLGSTMNVTLSQQLPFKIHTAGIQALALRTPLLKHVYLLHDHDFLNAAEQFIARLVLANPARGLPHYDAEYINFVRCCLAGRDLNVRPIPYSEIWTVMKELAPMSSDYKSVPRPLQVGL